MPGDRAALFCKNSTDYLIAIYAIWYAGGAVVPLNAKLHPREAAWIIANSRGKLLFADSGPAPESARDCADERHHTVLSTYTPGDSVPTPGSPFPATPNQPRPLIT